MALVLLFFAMGRIQGQVNLQTGGATFSLPMFNWQDHKSRLNATVSLNYNSGNGLKTSDVATNAGQGWNLIAGGVITRMQVGEPDDQKPREGSGIDDITKYPPGYLYNTKSADSGCPIALKNYPVFGDQNHLYRQHNSVAADRELDYFSFQFNGRTGMFVLSKTGDIGVPLGDSKIKISFERADMAGVRTTINAFTIQDENGLLYRFKNHLAKTKVLKNNYFDPGFIQVQTQPKFESETIYHESSFEDASIVNPYIINSWYLAEIEDALTHRKIIFGYSTHNINSAAGIDIAYYADKNYAVLSHKRSQVETPVISSVSFPDGHAVAFTYGKPRVDLTGDSALASVDVTYKSRYISKYQLNTTYFILNRYGTPVSDYQKQMARLCLRSVTQYSADLKGVNEPYIFDYYLGSSASDDFVPPPFSYAKDIWGFYNGTESKSTDGSSIGDLTKPLWEHSMPEIRGLCFLRNSTGAAVTLNPKTGYAKNGLLRQIRYPTGGSLSYEYEQNTGVLSSQNREVGGVHVARTKLVDGGYINDCEHPIVTNYNYVLSGGSQSSLWGLEAPKNKIQVINHYKAEKRYYYYKFPFGSCSFRYKYPGILSKEQSVSLTGNQQALQAVSEALNTFSTISTIVDIITYAASGTGLGAVIIDLIGGLVDVALTCFSPNKTSDNTTDIYYNSDINAANPLPVQFSRVEVSQASGNNGKTVFEFTSDADYGIWEPSNPSNSMRQRFAYWAYGLPKITTWFDSTGYKVKQTENIYDFGNSKHAFVSSGFAFPSCKCEVKENYSQRVDDWSDANLYDNAATSYQKNSNTDMGVVIYDIFTGRTQLQDSYERIYQQGGSSQFAEIATHYEYHAYGASNDNLLPYKVTTRQSNGVVNLKLMTYSDDYATGVLNTLNQNNILSEPVSTSTYIYDSTIIQTYNPLPGQTDLADLNATGSETLADEETVDAPDAANGFIDSDRTRRGELAPSTTFYGWKILNETVTEFTTVSNGNIKPYRTLVQRFDEPTYSYTLYAGPGSPSNPSGYKEIQTFSYDSQSNLVGLLDEGGHLISNIYGYDDKYVTGSVINAEQLLDKPAYTSFEETDFGGWILNGTAAYTTSNAATGTRSFVLSGANSISANLNTAKAYRLSFWASAGVSVSGSNTLVKSAPGIGGLTYYEYSIPQSTLGITISGSATLDELRIYPAGAMMRTVTYDPLLGKTAESDENNRITYYEYDELGRLRFIKDDQRNIVKMYEYNTTKKAGGCIVTYTNLLVREVYTKNSCGSGYMGGQYVYTIPANKYSSTNSQEEVDALVQQELHTYGQATANTDPGVTCNQIYYNEAIADSYIPETCPVGSVSAAVTYTVPAGRYSSLTSVAAANRMATNELRANGQAYANQHASCVVDTNPIWEGDENASTTCEVVNNQNTGYLLVYCKDVNPNSSSYNTYQWQKVSTDSATCPPQQGAGSLIGTNYIFSVDFSITITNISTNETYSYTLYGNSSNVILGNLPNGVYNISFTPSSYYTSFFNYQIGNSYSEYAPGSVTIYNVSVQNGAGLNITISQ